MAVIRLTIERIVQEAGNPWVTIHTDNDTVRRLDTKDEARIRQAVAAKGKTVDVQYTHRPSKNINPYTGKPYDNYYFDGIVEAEASHNGGVEGVEVVKRQQEREEDPRKAWRISLAAGAKLAVGTLPLMPDEQRDFETQKRIAFAWGHWLYTTPPPSSTPPSEVEFGGSPSGNPGAYGEPGEPPPFLDDEWPPAE